MSDHVSPLEFIGRMAEVWLLASLAAAALWSLAVWAKKKRRARDLRHLAELAAARREEDRRAAQAEWQRLARARRFGDLVVESRQEGRAS